MHVGGPTSDCDPCTSCLNVPLYFQSARTATGCCSLCPSLAGRKRDRVVTARAMGDSRSVPSSRSPRFREISRFRRIARVLGGTKRPGILWSFSENGAREGGRAAALVARSFGGRRLPAPAPRGAAARGPARRRRRADAPPRRRDPRLLLARRTARPVRLSGAV